MPCGFAHVSVHTHHRILLAEVLHRFGEMCTPPSTCRSLRECPRQCIGAVEASPTEGLCASANFKAPSANDPKCPNLSSELKCSAGDACAPRFRGAQHALVQVDFAPLGELKCRALGSGFRV